MGSLTFALLLNVFTAAPDGPAIYQEHCASCHGDQEEGVDEEYDEALIGKRSVASLAKYIDRKMPEDEEHLVVGEDALAVAEYIHAASYSPAAQARPQHRPASSPPARAYSTSRNTNIAMPSPNSSPPSAGHAKTLEREV